MEATTLLPPQQMIQLQSFWNLIQSSDEGVQRELYALLGNKYRVETSTEADRKHKSFLNMKGILKTTGSEETDRLMKNEYLNEKYGV